MNGVSRLGALGALVLFITACGDGRPEGWSDETHGKNAPPAYDTVFPSGQVKRIDLVIAPEDWQAMQDDMTDMLGAFGTGGGVPGGGGGLPGGGGGMTPPAELTAACEGKAEGEACTATFMGSSFTSTCRATQDGQQLCAPPGGPGGPGGGGVPGGGGGVDLVPRTPVYVPSTVKFEGNTWWYVGVRFKGNSTLSGSWRGGVGKMPFRLNFDHFEDEHPEIEDQHFHGFSKLSLSNGSGDASLIRDRIASEVFLQSGVPAARTSFVALYVDHGDGPEYFGLYTLAEDPQESMLRTLFGNDEGALYEADGTGATWGTFDEASFGPESKAAELGWESVQAAITELHSDRSDAAAWRARLETRLNVDGFLRWLAVNTVMVNWDNYGAMPHNYYLYAHPGDGGRLQWITWDHNLSMMSNGRATSLTHDEVTAQWPLIRYLMDDPTYRATYEQYARESIEGPLAAATLQERMREEHALIAPWVVGENAERQGFTFISTPQQFQDALTGTSGLLQHAAQREAAVRATFGTSP